MFTIVRMISRENCDSPIKSGGTRLFRSVGKNQGLADRVKPQGLGWPARRRQHGIEQTCTSDRYCRYWRHRRELGGGVSRTRLRCGRDGPGAQRRTESAEVYRRGLAGPHREGIGEECGGEKNN